MQSPFVQVTKKEQLLSDVFLILIHTWPECKTKIKNQLAKPEWFTDVFQWLNVLLWMKKNWTQSEGVFYLVKVLEILYSIYVKVTS